MTSSSYMKKGFTEVTTQPDFTKAGGASGLDLRKRILFAEIFLGRIAENAMITALLVVTAGWIYPRIAT